MKHVDSEDLLLIREVLKAFQEGYSLRDAGGAESFVDELYSTQDNTYVLGTGTGELFIGRDRIIELISDDWSYWGDVRLELDHPHIVIEHETAWVTVQGSVKYSFEDTPARYDSYLNFIKKKLEDQELSAEQKLTFLNWALMLTYHQREDKKRDYLWPLCLTGVLKKAEGKWKFVQQHFSICVADYPDERFEVSDEHRKAYHNQNYLASESKINQITEEDKLFLKTFEKSLFGQSNIDDKDLNKMLPNQNEVLVIGPDHTIYSEREQLKSYFSGFKGCKLSLTTEHSIVIKNENFTWITVTGIMEQDMEKQVQFEETLELLRSLTECEATSKDKIFMVQRRIAYLLKEISSGNHYTYPLRFSFVLSGTDGKRGIRQLHISYPSYWIFEGKLN
ncbi:MAG: hypothetical protein K0R34_1450 [Herbinix sp.]|jgi:hypothetical protein|nr:hypothetical protein [Herbinix sp.]